MRIHIYHTKARQDRYVSLCRYALDLLTQCWFQCGRPTGRLFPCSQKLASDKLINTYYLSWHIHKHEEQLGWPTRITCHSFWHAFGTHLYENGVDLPINKALLGHKSLKSTMLYVHLAATRFSDVINPLDKMGGIYGTK